MFSSDSVSPTRNIANSPGRENCIQGESLKILVEATYKGKKGQPMKIVKEVQEEETIISENIVKNHHVVMMIGMIESTVGDVELINLENVPQGRRHKVEIHLVKGEEKGEELTMTRSQQQDQGEKESSSHQEGNVWEKELELPEKWLKAPVPDKGCKRSVVKEAEAEEEVHNYEPGQGSIIRIDDTEQKLNNSLKELNQHPEVLMKEKNPKHQVEILLKGDTQCGCVK